MKISDVSIHECGGHHHVPCRSVSWNSTGNWLAMGGPNPRIWTIEGSNAGDDISGNNNNNNNNNNMMRCSEVLVISGHAPNSQVDRVRFHPTEPSQLCTSANDGTVRIFDIRAGAERAVGRVDVSSGKSAVYLDWCPPSPRAGGGSSGSASSYLAVTERDGSVRVYDARKLSSSGTSLNRGGGAAGAGVGRQNSSSSSSSKSTPLHSFQIPNVDVDACIFSPSGKHLVAATATRGGTMFSELRIWNWNDGQEAFQKSVADGTQFTVPAHTGPVFSMQFSPDGKRLATGSSDAIVGVWEVATMCCTATITRRLKFIRGVAFSHDSRWLANSSEEDGIDIANAITGEPVGMVQLRERPRDGSPVGGADEIAFNPTNGHILACAHLSPSIQSAAVVAKIRITA